MINVPNSLAIIPDGNRRLAKKFMENPWKGHEWGIKKLYDLLGWCKDIGIEIVTLYALSLENLKRRPKEELNYLFRLFERELDSIMKDGKHFVHKNNVKLFFFGRLNLLSDSLQDKINQVMEKTKKYTKYNANIAIAYGGRQEIIDAVNIAIKKGYRKISEDNFKRCLQLGGTDPDLIIRTSGELRVSNFLPFQSVYSEFVSTDTLWPELTREEFIEIIENFSGRQRRFGE